MDRTSRDLYSKLSQRPAFLFLGQDHLRLETGTDPFLEQVLGKYVAELGPCTDYSQILDGEAKESVESALAWMHQRCERFSIPAWLETVAKFPWSGVYTSAIDAIWPRAFRTEWRELQPLLEDKYRPSNPRNRSRLVCTFLFGNVERSEIDERPPLTRIEWLKRKHVAVRLMGRLPELVTPLGILLIEGYAGERDWLSPEDLLPIVDDLNSGQTHIFSATDELTRNICISELLRADRIVLHTESLASFLLRGQEAGFIALGERPEEFGRQILLNERTVTIPLDIWNQVSRSAMILDDMILAPPSTLSKEKRYREFRDFLAESSTKPVWSGYKRGFAYSRDFESKLQAAVERKMKSKELQDEPVILFGQTGTGKTVALGSLAYEICRQRQSPVLFIERKSRRPVNSDIDAFCKWAEDCGTSSTVVIWDGMMKIEEYYSLLKYLVGRGRKVVLVGSCYRDKELLKSKNLIEAPVRLAPAEKAGFVEFLNRFEPTLGELFKDRIAQSDDSFLVALFRLLPASRTQIRSGVIKEVSSAEQEINLTAREGVASNESMTPEVTLGTLGYALLEAGLVKPEELLRSKARELGGEEVDEIQALTGLVMVPGRFGLRIPLELLLRAMGKGRITEYIDLLSPYDIFRWDEDSAGNILIGPRHALEAMIFVQARLGGPKYEVDYAKRLLSEIQDSGNFLDNTEVQFASDLVRSMGPNGPARDYFAQYLLEISETLGRLREERSLFNVGLMLQEANLLRESVRERTVSGEPPEEAEELLEKAERILHQALDLLDRGRANKRQRAVLLVELAAALGTKASHILECTSHPKDAIQILEEARNLLFEARALDPENYVPIDVLAWTTRDILRSGVADTKSRVEAEADILHAFAVAETENLGFDQQERFHRRRWEIGNILGDRRLSEEAFDALVAQGSSAGYYLKANDLVRDLPLGAELNSAQRSACRTAVDYLEQNRAAINLDRRSLYLLLRLWWLMQTGKPMFYGERQAVPFNQEDWRYCVDIIIKLMATNELRDAPSLTYLHGLAAFHLGLVEDSFEIFRQLEHDSDYYMGRRRIIRSYLAGTQQGLPKKYTGEVRWVNSDVSKGGVHVTKLRRWVTFFPRDFGRPDIRKHESLGEFHIAFNFLGPIADPPSYLKGSQSERT